MRIYDGTELDIDIYEGGKLVGHVLGETSCERCPYCGAWQKPRPITCDKCGKCGAEYKQSMTGRWYWERDIQGEIIKLRERLSLRSQQIRSLRRELRKRS